ncbi:hypothetical protein [Methanothrix sp.]|jgi:hypothetical protein|uniref:hypothetical protein n=2 Tax=Methanothrix sp. TaxID=90426 RepID=UPI003BB5CF40
MIRGRSAATATGWLLLMLGGAMALITGKGDITVITAGVLIVFSGVYVLSLVKPASKQFIGAGWPEKFCRISAVAIGLIMVASGFISSISGIRDILISYDFTGIYFVIISLLPFGWGLYILKLAIYGVRS